MIKLNDYLYSGDTVLKILRKYSNDLLAEAKTTGDAIDLQHSEFIENILQQLEHNDFLTYQSNRIREFYKYMADKYPFLAFTFRGRIKSVIRSEEKFNGYIVEYIYNYYVKNHAYPPVEELQKQLGHFRDFIAYRIVISMPKCHLAPGQDREQTEIRYLYEIANALPDFLEAREFDAEPANVDEDDPEAVTAEAGRAAAADGADRAIAAGKPCQAGRDACGGMEEDIPCPGSESGCGGPELRADEPYTAGEPGCGSLAADVRPYYRDYVAHPKESGYRSLHIAFYDKASRSFLEVQLRTHEMDDFAEIGTANHRKYAREQNITRRRRDAVPEGENKLFDEAYERGMALQNLDLSGIDVNMFTAYSNSLMNDGCGLYHGRLILPFEHLSRFQNDLVG